MPSSLAGLTTQSLGVTRSQVSGCTGRVHCGITSQAPRQDPPMQVELAGPCTGGRHRRERRGEHRADVGEAGAHRVADASVTAAGLRRAEGEAAAAVALAAVAGASSHSRARSRRPRCRSRRRSPVGPTVAPPSTPPSPASSEKRNSSMAVGPPWTSSVGFV